MQGTAERALELFKPMLNDGVRTQKEDTYARAHTPVHVAVIALSLAWCAATRHVAHGRLSRCHVAAFLCAIR